MTLQHKISAGSHYRCPQYRASMKAITATTALECSKMVGSHRSKVACRLSRMVMRSLLRSWLELSFSQWCFCRAPSRTQGGGKSSSPTETFGRRKWLIRLDQAGTRHVTSAEACPSKPRESSPSFLSLSYPTQTG